MAGNSVDSLIIRIDATTELLRRELQKGDASVRKFADGTDKHLSRFESRFARIGSTVRTAIGGLGIAFGAAGIASGLRSAAGRAIEFEKSLSRVTGLVGTSRREVAEFRDEVRRLGRTTGKGPQELAEAFFFVQSAGIEGAAAIDVLEKAAQAASAGLGSTATVADAVTSAINAYGAANLDAAEATDVLVATVREGKAGADTIATALGRVIPIAAEMGVEFNEVGATIAALTRVGASAEESSTALAAALQSLLKPGAQAEETLRRYGLSVSQLRAAVRDNGLLDTLLDLTETFGDNETAMAEVFSNARALRGILGLVGKNANEVRVIFDELLDPTNALNDAYAAWAETTDGKVSVAMTQLDEQLLRLGSKTLPLLASALGVVVDTMEGIENASEKAGNAIEEHFLGSSDLVDRWRKDLEQIDEFLSGNRGRAFLNLDAFLGDENRFTVTRERLQEIREELGLLIQNHEEFVRQTQANQAEIDVQARLVPRVEFSEEDRQRLRDLVNRSFDDVPIEIRQRWQLDAGIDFDESDADELRDKLEATLDKIELTADLRDQIEQIKIETLRAEGQVEEAIRASGQRRVEAFRESAEASKLSAQEIAEAIDMINRQTEISVENFNKSKTAATEFSSAFAASFESRGMQAFLDGDFSDAVRGFIDDIVELIFRLTVLEPIARRVEDALSNIGSGGSGGNSLAQQPSGGFLGGILGTIFGGRRESGGPVAPRRSYLVGERGPEMFVPNVAGDIVTASRRRSQAQAMPIVIEQTFEVQAGLPPQWEGQLSAVAEVAARTAHDAIARRQTGRR